MESQGCFNLALSLRPAILLNPSGALNLLDAVCLALLFLSLELLCFGFSCGEWDGFGLDQGGGGVGRYI